MESREQAKKEYLAGKSMKAIAEELSINYNTVRQWRVRDNWPSASVTKKRNKKLVAQILIDEPEEPKDLKEKEKLFCRLYVKNFNGTRAAIDAGYTTPSAHVTASRLLKKDKIKDYINKLKGYKTAVLLLKCEDIVEKQMRIAFSDITDFVEFGAREAPMVSNGKVIMTTDEATGEDKPFMYPVNSMEIKDSVNVDGGIISEISQGPSGVKIKLEDRAKALDWLSKYFEFNPMDKHKREYDNTKLELDKQRLEHQKDMDERNNF